MIQAHYKFWHSSQVNLCLLPWHWHSCSVPTKRKYLILIHRIKIHQTSNQYFILYFYLDLLSDGFQIYWLLNDSKIIRILLNKKNKKRSYSKLKQTRDGFLKFYRGCVYHFGGKLLEQLTDQATSWLHVRHDSIKELLKDVFQTGRSSLTFKSRHSIG